MRLTRTVAPAEQAITLLQAKDQCRVSTNDEDDALDLMIEAVTDHLDGPAGILGRAIVTQTWLLEMDGWPVVVALPVEPVQSVSVTWLNAAGEATALDASNYVLDVAPAARPVLRWVDGAQLPVTGTQPYPVRITIVAGFGAASVVPSGLKKAMLRMVEHWYLGQGAGGPGSADAVPLQVSAMLARWRVLL